MSVEQDVANRLSELGMTPAQIDWHFGGSAASAGVDPALYPTAIPPAGRPPMIARRNSGSQNINSTTSSNGVDIQFSVNDRTDAGWSVASNSHFTFAGSPDRVRLNAMVLAKGTGGQRTNQIVWIQNMNTGRRWKAATGYIRWQNDHEYSSWTFAAIDEDPGTNPEYRIRATRETSVSSAVNTVANDCSLAFEAVL